MSRVVVLGSSNTDLVLRGERLPRPGETVPASEFLQTQGGKGANQAVAAVRSGAQVMFIGAVGDDAFGHAACSQYKLEGLDLSHFRVLSDAPSGMAMIFVDERGRNMISVHGGANHRVTSSDIAALPDAVFEAPGIFAAQLETPLDAVATALDRARRAGMVTILNPAPMRTEIASHDLLRRVDLLIPNELEAGQLIHDKLRGIRKIRIAAAKIASLTQGHVIVTLGSKGCLWQQPNESTSVHFQAVRVRPLDTVAAGDAFIGALAARLALAQATPATLTGHLPNAIRWAAHAAAISVTRPGAQPSLPHAKETEAFQTASNPDLG